MGELSDQERALLDAAAYYQRAKLLAERAAERVTFVEATLKKAKEDALEAARETDRALSTVLRLTRGETIPKTEPNPGVAGCGYGYVPEALKA